nr:MAG: hypothetical protein 2 [Leviviridae sp.]
MYADPQSLTIGGAATSFVRQGSPKPDSLGMFQDASGVYDLQVRQNKTSTRFRREVRLTKRVVASDPISAINKEQSASIMIVIDEPKWGFSDATLAEMSAALITWFSASSYAKQGQLLSGES